MEAWKLGPDEKVVLDILGGPVQTRSASFTSTSTFDMSSNVVV